MIYYALLGALALQRLNEVKLGSANLALMKPRLVSPLNETEKRQMIFLHSAWFASCAAEHAWHGHLLGTPLFLIGILVLVACQGVRYASMKALGECWVHLPVAFRGQRIVDSGIYRYFRHPNYLAVAVEIAVVPLLAQAYFTAAAFTVLNAIFLIKRIRIEEQQLEKARNL